MKKIEITRAGMGEKCPNPNFKKLLAVGMITACQRCPYFVRYDGDTICVTIKSKLWQRKFMRSIAQTTGIHTQAANYLL